MPFTESNYKNDVLQFFTHPGYAYAYLPDIHRTIAYFRICLER